jgi:TonB family protein
MRRAAVALVFAAMASFTARAQDPAPFDEKGNQWGTPIRIVTPDYPKAALAAGRTGYVDVSGVVNGLRILDDVRMEADSPPNADMVDAVREVIKYWRFQPPTGNDCTPRPERVTNRVWFEAANGQPHISVTMPKRLGWSEADAARYRATSRPAPSYPERAIRQGAEAVVWARIDTAPDGRVTEVRAKAFSAQRGVALAVFENEVIQTLSRWTYPPIEGGAPSSRAMCYEVNFAFKD